MMIPRMQWMKEQNWTLLNEETVEETPEVGEDGGGKIEKKNLLL